MELRNSRSLETVEFTATLERLTELVKTAFGNRTPHLNGEKYLTNRDLSKLLHMSKRTLQEYRDSGMMPYIKISGKVLYKESDILKLLESHYVNHHRF